MSNSSANNGSSIYDEEKDDFVAPLCTCGQFNQSEDGPSVKTSKSKKTPTWLESSFVHLITPRRTQQSNSSSRQQPHHYHPQHGFLEQHQHLSQLMDAASTTEVSICMDCIDRVAAALESDTQRLYSEAQAYHEAVSDSKQKAKRFESISKLDLAETERAYQNEIEMLRQEVEAREAELSHLNDLYKEQLQITEQQECFEDQVQQEHGLCLVGPTTHDQED